MTNKDVFGAESGAPNQQFDFTACQKRAVLPGQGIRPEVATEYEQPVLLRQKRNVAPAQSAASEEARDTVSVPLRFVPKGYRQGQPKGWLDISVPRSWTTVILVIVGLVLTAYVASSILDRGLLDPSVWEKAFDVRMPWN